MAKVPIPGIRQGPVVKTVESGQVPVLPDTRGEVVLDAPWLSETAHATRAAVIALPPLSCLWLSPERYPWCGRMTPFLNANSSFGTGTTSLSKLTKICGSCAAKAAKSTALGTAAAYAVHTLRVKKDVTASMFVLRSDRGREKIYLCMKAYQRFVKLGESVKSGPRIE